jgi:thymidylate synthase
MIKTIKMRNNFETANEAYEYFHDRIIQYGASFGDTKALFNVGFYIHQPSKKQIINSERKWNLHYADSEWKWYLSGDPNISKLGEIYGKVPAIWKRMADEYGNVNSNYGYQWQRTDWNNVSQYEKVVQMLKDNPETRQAAISIYDGKEINKYKSDTPCTYAVQFTILNGELCMSVYMRSNDLWYGFCNDQYQFASLQELVARELDIPTGWYYHHAHNLHLYNDKI